MSRGRLVLRNLGGAFALIATFCGLVGAYLDPGLPSLIFPLLVVVGGGTAWLLAIWEANARVPRPSSGSVLQPSSAVGETLLFPPSLGVGATEIPASVERVFRRLFLGVVLFAFLCLDWEAFTGLVALTRKFFIVIGETDAISMSSVARFIAMLAFVLVFAGVQVRCTVFCFRLLTQELRGDPLLPPPVAESGAAVDEAPAASTPTPRPHGRQTNEAGRVNPAQIIAAYFLAVVALLIGVSRFMVDMRFEEFAGLALFFGALGGVLIVRFTLRTHPTGDRRAAARSRSRAHRSIVAASRIPADGTPASPDRARSAPAQSSSGSAVALKSLLGFALLAFLFFVWQTWGDLSRGSCFIDAERLTPLVLLPLFLGATALILNLWCRPLSVPSQSDLETDPGAPMGTAVKRAGVDETLFTEAAVTAGMLTASSPVVEQRPAAFEAPAVGAVDAHVGRVDDPVTGPERRPGGTPSVRVSGTMIRLMALVVSSLLIAPVFGRMLSETPLLLIVMGIVQGAICLSVLAPANAGRLAETEVISAFREAPVASIRAHARGAKISAKEFRFVSMYWGFIVCVFGYIDWRLFDGLGGLSNLSDPTKASSVGALLISLPVTAIFIGAGLRSIFLWSGKGSGSVLRVSTAVSTRTRHVPSFPSDEKPAAPSSAPWVQTSGGWKRQ